MAALSEEVKSFIVRSLACFNTPQEVADLVKEEYEIDIVRGHVAKYDPTKVQGKSLGAKYKAIFEATRKSFLEDMSQIPMANAAVRVQELSKMFNEARNRKNNVLAAQHIEQIAKEVGGSYTNKVKLSGSLAHTGAGGGPIETKTTLDVAGLTNEQLKAIASIKLNKPNS